MTEEVTAMRNPRLTDNDTRNDFHRSLQAMRDTLPRLREDYLYLEEHTADDDLVKAIVAFEQRIAQEIDRHEEELARARAMHRRRLAVTPEMSPSADVAAGLSR